MNVVKTKLRNRLQCETVDSVLSTRYGLSLRKESCANFLPSQEMLKRFTAQIYLDEEVQEDETAQMEDICEAIECLEGL